ncbi:TetR/AcrR family transcriptional regulator C-terminal domain-containing protein [Specibacter cremeus]|uniref:TetR/AcrR family transcriptional regulator C-terminal domain-containing protein n=1 Tax=Specibacter cremeus TaxID=1629051 RepID=UPI000F792F41|nr:TetR/AcrR family transcriptional regulator C-terminal domain-containing protein [Specibacter cremeus]
MDVAPKRRAGRPRRAVLDRDRILGVALDLLNSVGPQRFTMSALAAELGVQTPALYHYVGGKAELLAGMREVISDRIDATSFAEKAWDEAVVDWARSYRLAFAAHPNAIAIFATEPIAGAHRTLAMYEQVMRGFLAAGWAESEVLNHVVVLESFILGSALDAVAPPTMFDPADDAPDTPALARVYDRREAGGRDPADAAFELGLSVLVAGLKASR